MTTIPSGRYSCFMKKESAKGKLLESAKKILKEEGYEKFTLDSLAKKTGVSKGGVLYHFPTKERLIQEIIENLIIRFENRLHSEENADSSGSWTLRYFQATLDDLDDSDLQSSGIIAALASNPHLLLPLVEKYSAWKQKFKKEKMDQSLADILRFAADGIWFNEVFGLSVLSRKEKKQILERAEKLAGEKK